jgi:hypothetical protein
MDEVLTDSTKLDPAVFNIANLAMMLEISSFQNMNNSLALTNKANIQNEINTLKNQTSQLFDKAVKQLNISDNSSILLGNSLYSAQLSSTHNESLADSMIIALENKLSLIDAGSCYITLKQHYNISNLLVLKTDANSYLQLDNLEKPLVSNSAQIKLFNPITREELNMSLCNNDQLNIKTPIKSANLLNLTMYSDLNSSGIDGFNPNDTSYNNICSTHIDETSSYDTTLNFRRSKYFQNKTAQCSGTNCTYQSIDANNYVSCNCYLQPAEPINNEFVNFVLTPLSTWNFDVILCYNLIATVIVYLT